MEDEEKSNSPETPGGEAPAQAPESDESQQAPVATADVELPADLPAAYKKVLAEKLDLYDRLLRKQAELENARKRLQREKEDFLQTATADLVRALLPILDGFERALKHRDAKVPEGFYHGVELIYRSFLEVLTRAGLSAVEATGKIFDPHVHQAVETVEAEGYRDHEVIEELQRGYKLRYRLLRPAIVKVAVPPKASPAREEQPSDSG